VTEIEGEDDMEGGNPVTTKDKILNASEQLFANNGYHNTSLRAITREAGVNLAAVNYHFGSKQALLEEVISRHLDPLNRVRREKLLGIREKARGDGAPPSTGEVLRAFIVPMLHYRETDPGADAFIALVGRIISDPDEGVREIFMDHIRPIFFLCFEVLCESLPHISKEILFWRLQFAIGAMSRALYMGGQFVKYPDGIDAKYDAEAMAELIFPFVTAGMVAQ